MLKNQNQIVAVFFFAFLLFVMWQLGVVFSPFFRPIFWACILTFAFYPMYKWLLSRLGRPAAASGITTAILLVIVIVPAIFVAWNLITQTVELADKVSRWEVRETVESIKNTTLIQRLYDQAARFGPIRQGLKEWPAEFMKTVGAYATSQIAALTKNVFVMAFNLILVVFMLFFLFRDGEKIYEFVHRLVPMEKKDKEAVFSKINDTFASVIRGQFLTSLFQGTITGVAFFMLGLPAPVFFAFATFICTLIPVLGAASVWGPFAVYLYRRQESVAAPALAAIGVLLISAIDNVIKPILIGERMKIPIFLLFIGVLGGLRAYGMLGMFLGPLFIALFFVLAKIYQDRYSTEAIR